MENTLELLYNIQKEFTKDFFEKVHGFEMTEILKDKNKRIRWSKEYILLLIKEATEMLDEIDFKTHKKKVTDENLEKFLEEGIDTFKYLLGLLILNGFTSEQIYNKFIEKSNIVSTKFEQDIKELENK